VRVLVVEDERRLAGAVQRGLKAEGFAVDLAFDGADGLHLAREGAYDAVVLDLMLPKLSGYQVCERLRAEENWVPVLILSAKDGEYDQADGLDLGADDYLTKPFAIAEFEARVRALLRRTSVPSGPRLFRGLSVDTEIKRVKVHDVAVDLTVREWALLELFLARPGRVLSKEQIAQQLVNYDDSLSPNTIEVYVSRLRSKIETEGVKIRTVRGFGYLWEAEGA
jgi:DNA-binding response OmpR family regulator